MLALIAFGMVALFMILIMTKRLSAMTALVLVPTATAVLAGFASGLGPMMLTGIREVAPTGVMILFAILYFGIMIDVGLFDPLVAKIVSVVKGDPVRILLGTAVLALCVSLDGDGATTYIITVSAMLPLYAQMKLDVRKMACVIMLAGGAMNILPWGGPTARAASALRIEPSALFVPMIPALAVCVCWVLFVAYRLGMGERKRLALAGGPAWTVVVALSDVTAAEPARAGSLRRPRLFAFNLALTAALMGMLVWGAVPLPVLFMIGFALAATLNYPSVAEQRRRLEAHAGNALAVAGLIFAAGIFMGVLSGTGMVDAMAHAIIGRIPAALGPYLAPITGLLSIPLTFLISNDAFYFGILPILAKTAAGYGIAPEALARASLIGQPVHLLSPLVASTYLLVGLSGIELGEHQRFTMRWALGSCIVMLISAIAFGVFPLAA
jgi:CitMHS family citrate-Mg2+:H+ or citrate-Ca2+:H+ symporter